MFGKMLTALSAVLVIALSATPAVSHDLVAIGIDTDFTVADGKPRITAGTAGRDSLVLIDLDADPPGVTVIEGIPNSVVGPPSGIAITPDGQFILVTNPYRLEKQGGRYKHVQDRIVSVIDLTTEPPALIGHLEVGLQPSGIAINAKGDRALIANAGDGTVTLLSIDSKKKEFKVLDKVSIGTETSNAADVAITDDGKRALVTKPNENAVAVLSIRSRSLRKLDGNIRVGSQPYQVEIVPDEKVAVVANAGMVDGHADTVSLIDLSKKPYRVVSHETVGLTPEGIAVRPDGRCVAVAVMQGSNLRSGHFARRKNGELILYSLEGKRLREISREKIGRASQGVVFSRTGNRLVVANHREKKAQIFKIVEGKLEKAGDDIKLPGPPGSIGASGH